MGIDVGLMGDPPSMLFVEPRRGWPRLAGIFFNRARYETMPAYRLYPMSMDGHIAGPPTVIDCADDQEAVQAAEDLANGHALEVWDSARFVVRIESKTL